MQQPFLLIRGRKSDFVTANLVDLAQKHVEDFELLWREQLQTFTQSDKYWDWWFKKRVSISRDNYES